MKLLLKTIGLFLNGLAVFLPRQAGRLGFTLLCRPVRGKLGRRHHDFFASAERFQLRHGSDTVQCYQWGSGPAAILLLHGWQSHSYYWKDYVEALNLPHYTVYAFDAPGHGLSSGSFLTMPLYSDVVHTVMQHIGPVDTVVSHSLGSLTALYTFYRHPALSPARLVALSPPAQIQEFFDSFEEELGLTKRCVQQVVGCFEQLVQQPVAYYSAPRFAEALAFPGLLIHDQHDQHMPVANAKAIHAKWKQSRLLITEGKGHALRSKDVVKTAADFITDNYTQLRLLSVQ